MKLAFSTNAYLKFSFAEAVARLARIGYAGVEIMADVPHAWPAYLLEEQKQAIRDALSRNNLRISNVNSFMMHAVNDPRQKYWHPSWIEPDPHYRQIRIDHTKRALTLARELGAPCITTEPGGPVEKGASWSAALKQFVEGLKPVLEHAEKEGVLEAGAGNVLGQLIELVLLLALALDHVQPAEPVFLASVCPQ